MSVLYLPSVAQDGHQLADGKRTSRILILKVRYYGEKSTLAGNLKADHQQLLDVPGFLSLVYGKIKIDLKGVLGEKSDFYADIKAPNLQGLVLNLKSQREW